MNHDEQASSAEPAPPATNHPVPRPQDATPKDVPARPREGLKTALRAVARTAWIVIADPLDLL